MAKAAVDPHLRLRVGLVLAILLLLLVAVVAGPPPPPPPSLPPPAALPSRPLQAAMVEQFTRRDAGRGIAVERLRLRSESSGGSFPVDVVLPPVLPQGAPLLLLFGDAAEEGAAWFRRGDLLESLALLWAQGAPPMLVALPVTPAGRPTLSFRRHMQELQLALLQRYPLSPKPADHCIAGYSRGGALALLLALENPTFYGRVAVAAPQPGNINGYLLDALRIPSAKLEVQFVHTGDPISRQLLQDLKSAGIHPTELSLPEKATQEEFGKKLLSIYRKPAGDVTEVR